MKLRKLFLAVLAGATMLMACDKKEVDLGPAKLTVNPTDVSFEAEVSSQDISLVATRDWAVTALPDWVALSKEAGSANPDAQKLSISVTENKGYNRSATIVFSIGFARQAITINQVGPDGEVDNGDGTKEKPFTVAGAIEYVKTLGADVESPKVFVKGIVSSVETTFEASGTYGNAIFDIVDEEGSSDVFKVFQTYYLGGVKWTKGDNNPDIKEKDEVIIYGPIYNYKGNTPETVGKGASFIYSLNGVNRGGIEDNPGGETAEAKGTGTLEDPFNVAAAIAKAVETGETATADTYYIKGKVKTISEQFAAQYGNASFTMVDEGYDAVFTAFRVLYFNNQKWALGGKELAENDEVIVCAKIVNFKGNTPETSGGYVYSINGESGSGGQGGGTGTPSGTGVKDDPYNVAAAVAAVKDLTWTSNTDFQKVGPFYVKGKVSSVKFAFDAEHGTATFDISDDGTTTASQFTCYSVKYFDGAAWVEGNTQVTVGADVVIYGELQNYKGNTPETVTGSYVVSISGGEVPPTPGPGGDANVIKLNNESTWTAGTDGTYGAGFEMTASNGVKVGVYKHKSSNAIVTPDQYSVRVYKNAVIVVSAPAGKKITSLSFKANDTSNGQYCVSLTYVEGSTGIMEADKGTMIVGTFTGSAEKVVLQAAEGQARLVEAYVALDGEGGDTPGGDTPGGDTPAKPVNEGTLESPFTVADALIAAKDADLTGKEYYVKAVVGKDIAIKNGVASFELMDGTTDGKLTVVKAKSFKGAAFDGSEPLDWLDEVVLKGTVTEYSTLPALTEGELVLWNGKKTFKDPEKDLSKIIALAKDADAYFEGLVSAVTTKSFVVTDGTNNVYVYQPATMAAIGDKVTVMGTAGAYNGLFQINKSSEVEVISSGNTVTYPDATDITTGFDTYATTVNAFVKVLANVTVTEGKVTVAVEGATAALQVTDAPEALGLAALDGKKAYITGYYGGSYTKNSATTKYIFATKVAEYSPAAPAWTLKELSQLADGDIAVIVSIKGEDKFALSNDKGTSAAPTAVAFTEDGNPADNIQWTVSVSESKYSFTASGSNKLYCTTANNGVRVGTNENNIFVIDASGYLKNVATERYLGVYNKADWRCYTNTTGNTAGQTFKAYVKTK